MATKNSITIIRKSCITGKAVWIYIGPSVEAAKRAYYRACQHEIERVRRLSSVMAQRKANIVSLLNKCMESTPFTGRLQRNKKKAARELLGLTEDSTMCDLEFYNHIMEERRRRAADMKIRTEMRERGIEHNSNYDK
jgi:hypothetical protein